MNSIKPTPVIGCIFLTLFATQVMFSETDGNNKRYNNYCEPEKLRCNPYSSSRCVESKVCVAHYQECGREPAPPNNSHLPQYLAIGDSIARGMFPLLKAKLEGIVEAHINPGTPETAADGARCIETWVGPKLDRWDVISFNFGLNDSVKTPTDSAIARYGLNIKDIAAYLMKTKAGKNGKLISILTIPTANTSCCPNTTISTGPMELPCPYNIKSYNYEIRQVVTYFVPFITIEDLFSTVNLACCHHSDCFFDSCTLFLNSSGCPTNFTLQGWDFLANNVSFTVREVLKKEYYVT